MTTPPLWLELAQRECPKEASEVRRLELELQQLPKEAALSAFVGLYENMLEARDQLYAVWISRQADE